MTLGKNIRVRLPKGGDVKAVDSTGNEVVYEFPAECEVRTEAVPRNALGLTISIAVLGICLWGTLMGCLIPLGLHKLGIDPAIASGAAVATVVDVTGIVIFLGAASLLLL
jgi:magnesium transporter